MPDIANELEVILLSSYRLSMGLETRCGKKDASGKNTRAVNDAPGSACPRKRTTHEIFRRQAALFGARSGPALRLKPWCGRRRGHANANDRTNGQRSGAAVGRAGVGGTGRCRVQSR